MNHGYAAAIRALTATAQQSPRAHVTVIGGLLLFGFVVWPVYVFPAGYPQPMTFAFAFAFGLLCLFEPEAIARLLRQQGILLVSAFAGYTLLVNSVAAIVGQDPEPLVHSLYYLQVLLACVVVVFVFQNWARAPLALHRAIVLALLIQAAVLLATGITEGGRAMLLFGNPNQLGFFALLALGYVLHLHTISESSHISTLVGTAIAVALVLASLSKAAIVAAIVMLYLFVCLGPLKGTVMRRARPLLILTLPTLLGVLVYTYRDELAFADAVVNRLASIGLSEDDSLTGRGYSRIMVWPQYALLGAGEGLFARWNSHMEIHSMAGTLLFSYGLPGVLIVAVLFVLMWRCNPRGMVIFGLPVVLYSLTHQPMRQPMMWMLLLLVAHSALPGRELRTR